MEEQLSREKKREFILGSIYQKQGTELLNLFKSQGISPDSHLNHMAYTALHVIASMDIPEGVQLAQVCVECGANVDMPDEFGRTPLHFAAGTDNLALVTFLVTEAGANVDAQTKAGETPLMKAIGMGKCDIVDILLTNKADTTISTANNDTAWTMVEASHNTAMVQMFKRYKEYLEDKEVQSLQEGSEPKQVLS